MNPFTCREPPGSEIDSGGLFPAGRGNVLQKALPTVLFFNGEGPKLSRNGGHPTGGAPSLIPAEQGVTGDGVEAIGYRWLSPPPRRKFAAHRSGSAEYSDATRHMGTAHCDSQAVGCAGFGGGRGEHW